MTIESKILNGLAVMFVLGMMFFAFCALVWRGEAIWIPYTLTAICAVMAVCSRCRHAR